MSLYSLQKLMQETRKLAAEYHKATQKSLPVTAELARYDAISLLGLEKAPDTQTGIDAFGDTWQPGQPILIKGRVIFDEKKRGQRIGQLNLEADWAYLLLVLLNADYEPDAIYAADRPRVLSALDDSATNKRGVLTVAKFKSIAECVWDGCSSTDSLAITPSGDTIR